MRNWQDSSTVRCGGMFLRISRTFAIGGLDSLAHHGVRNSRLMQRTDAAQAEPKFGGAE
jgi:hypothetical protein